MVAALLISLIFSQLSTQNWVEEMEIKRVDVFPSAADLTIEIQQEGTPYATIVIPSSASQLPRNHFILFIIAPSPYRPLRFFPIEHPQLGFYGLSLYLPGKIRRIKESGNEKVMVSIHRRSND